MLDGNREGEELMPLPVHWFCHCSVKLNDFQILCIRCRWVSWLDAGNAPSYCTVGNLVDKIFHQINFLLVLAYDDMLLKMMSNILFREKSFDVYNINRGSKRLDYLNT